MTKYLFRLVMLGGVAAGAWYGYSYISSLPSRQEQVPTTRVRKGDVTVRTFARGELRAVRSVTLTAPNLFGTVQVTKLAALGSLAREKDLVVEFDDSELLSRIEEKQLELDQTEEQIKKARADLAIRNNQDQVELLRARYSVRRAELEVKRNELLSTIDAKKNELNLEEARRRLKQLESDIKSRQQQAEAQLAVLQEQRNKAVLELNREKNRLMQVKMLSPITGLVAIRQNRATTFFVPGMQIPDIREGDQVQPGMPVADVLDLSEVEVLSRVGELDRANLKEGQEVMIMLDAIPETRLKGRIKSMSGTASSSVFANDPAKKFDVVFSVDMRQLLKSLGADQAKIDRILSTAEANRKKGIATPPAGGGGFGAMMAGMPGGMPGAGGGGPQMMPFAGGVPGGAGGEGGDGAGGEGRRRFGAAGGGGFAGGAGGAGGAGAFFATLTDEQRSKMREIMQKMNAGGNPAEMDEKQRAEFQNKMRAELAKAGIKVPEGVQLGGGRRGGGGPGGPGGAGGRNGGFPGGFGGFGGGSGAQQFSAKDLENAKLPPPPEEDSQLDLLLRPGMLADVEIIVERVPDAIYVPNQAVFERDGKPFVYVRANNRFEERPVTIAKRTESTAVIATGVEAGDVVAMADPNAKPGAKKKSESKGGAMGALPGGGKK